MSQVSGILGDVCAREGDLRAGQEALWRCIQEPWQQVLGDQEHLGLAGSDVQGTGVTHWPEQACETLILSFSLGTGLLSLIHCLGLNTECTRENDIHFRFGVFTGIT